MALIDSEDAAGRLARVIVSDIEVYNKRKLEAGAKLTAELEEGYAHFRSRVVPALLPLFEMVVANHVRLAGQLPGSLVTAKRAPEPAKAPVPASPPPVEDAALAEPAPALESAPAPAVESAPVVEPPAATQATSDLASEPEAAATTDVAPVAEVAPAAEIAAAAQPTAVAPAEPASEYLPDDESTDSIESTRIDMPSHGESSFAAAAAAVLDMPAPISDETPTPFHDFEPPAEAPAPVSAPPAPAEADLGAAVAATASEEPAVALPAAIERLAAATDAAEIEETGRHEPLSAPDPAAPIEQAAAQDTAAMATTAAPPENAETPVTPAPESPAAPAANDPEAAARRLARVIISDIEIYNPGKIAEGADLTREINEGRAHFRSRMEPHLFPLFETMLVERGLVRGSASSVPAPAPRPAEPAKPEPAKPVVAKAAATIERPSPAALTSIPGAAPASTSVSAFTPPPGSTPLPAPRSTRTPATPAPIPSAHEAETPVMAALPADSESATPAPARSTKPRARALPPPLPLDERPRWAVSEPGLPVDILARIPAATDAAAAPSPARAKTPEVIVTMASGFDPTPPPVAEPRPLERNPMPSLMTAPVPPSLLRVPVVVASTPVTAARPNRPGFGRWLIVIGAIAATALVLYFVFA
jgi:hypothetical protein